MNFSDKPTLPVDVCIIGTGAAGATLALDLAQRGWRVLVLESGKHYPRDQSQDYLTQFMNLEKDPFKSEIKGLDDFTTNGAVKYRAIRVKAVGGTTLRWKGNTPRLHPCDFMMKSRTGMSVDWPVSYDEVESYYVKAEASLGVAGAADNPFEGPRSAPYPLPEFPWSTVDRFFMPAFDKLGLPYHHIPQARNSVEYQGRAKCLNSATCGPYCPSGAKACMSEYQIPAALATGNVQIIPRASVLRFEWNSPERIKQVVYHREGETHSVEAPVFVMAVGGLETPRLLLLSDGPGHLQGLGNNEDQVGRYFLDHPAYNAVAEISEKVYSFRGPYQTLFTQRYYPVDSREEGGCFSIQVQNWGGFRPSMLAMTSQKRGPELIREMQERFGHQVALEIMTDQMPSPDNRITLDPEKKDGLGQALPRITWDVGEYGERSRDTAYALCMKIFDALGCVEKVHPLDELIWGNHHSGTARMGNDPKTSVVDRNVKLHGVDNLYVCSSACFPTIGSAHPTLSIAMLAHRLADHLATA